MTTIHAYRRSSPCSVELFGEAHKFVANDKGDLVCEVPPGPALDRLLEIKEGYKVYGATVEADEPDAPSPYVLTMEEEGNEVTVDLRKLDLAALQAFCTENEIKFHVNSKEPKLRDTIVAFFKVE